MSRNALGEVEAKAVLSTQSYIRNRLYTLELSGGRLLEVSGEHPFWVDTAQSYIEVRDLKVGDRLFVHSRRSSMLDGSRITGPAGSTVSIRRITSKAKRARVYTFEVEGNHNYFAADVLVHNKTMCVSVLTEIENGGGNGCGQSGDAFCGSNSECQVLCTCIDGQPRCVYGRSCSYVTGQGACCDGVCTGPSNCDCP